MLKSCMRFTHGIYIKALRYLINLKNSGLAIKIGENKNVSNFSQL